LEEVLLNWRDFLWAKLPESHQLIRDVETVDDSAGEHGGFVGIYSYTSVVFWWGVFEPALRQNDSEVVERCISIINEVFEGRELFSKGEIDLVRESLLVRVMPFLVANWPQFRDYASRILQRYTPTD
jgi:hypothetical protein